MSVRRVHSASVARCTSMGDHERSGQHGTVAPASLQGVGSGGKSAHIQHGAFGACRAQQIQAGRVTVEDLVSQPAQQLDLVRVVVENGGAYGVSPDRTRVAYGTALLDDQDRVSNEELVIARDTRDILLSPAAP